MSERCKHTFEDTPAVFTGAARTRTCSTCDRIEVMLAKTGQWMHIDEYLDRCIANRSQPAAQGSLRSAGGGGDHW